LGGKKDAEDSCARVKAGKPIRGAKGEGSGKPDSLWFSFNGGTADRGPLCPEIGPAKGHSSFAFVLWGAISEKFSD